MSILLLFMQTPIIDTVSPPPKVVLPQNVVARDKEYDEGQTLIVEWQGAEKTIWIEDSTYVPKGKEKRWIPEVLTPEYYIVYRVNQNGEKKEVGKALATQVLFEDNDTEMKNGKPYTYIIGAVFEDGNNIYESKPSNTAVPQQSWFHVKRLNVLIVMIAFFALVLWLISATKKGKPFFIRRIPGLTVLDEAVGRATEMGKPILFVPGLSGISDIATLAALNILGEVVKKAAEFDTPIIVPSRDPIVYTVTREVVKEAYSSVGRPDAFNPDNIYYITGDQFGFTSAVNGIMVREKTATNFFMGMFWAESLLLAETGASTGAIQIAGTDAVSQLPFFIISCDYTIIGEELYAASAYLSKEPMLLSTIKAQDYSKAVMMIVLLGFSILGIFGLTQVLTLLQSV